MNRPPARAYALISVVISLATGSGRIQAQSPYDSSWQKETETRLQAIYTRGEFRPQKSQPTWLPDSSGYTVEERDPTTDQMIRRSYDVRTGTRTESKAGEGKPSGRGPLLSPDGKRVLEFENRNIFVRDLTGGQRTQLTQRSAVRDISYRNPVWSPDGKRIVFVESDSTNVRQRAVLVPEDPSYPGVRNNRFARVGEELAKLRIGVVDSGEKNVQ
ncbi:MAG: DPP IV N-terminal domain-containing protein, partial [Verrucomicrobiales bacterium]